MLRLLVFLHQPVPVLLRWCWRCWLLSSRSRQGGHMGSHRSLRRSDSTSGHGHDGGWDPERCSAFHPRTPCFCAPTISRMTRGRFGWCWPMSSPCDAAPPRCATSCGSSGGRCTGEDQPIQLGVPGGLYHQSQRRDEIEARLVQGMPCRSGSAVQEFLCRRVAGGGPIPPWHLRCPHLDKCHEGGTHHPQRWPHA